MHNAGSKDERCQRSKQGKRSERTASRPTAQFSLSHCIWGPIGALRSLIRIIRISVQKPSLRLWHVFYLTRVSRESRGELTAVCSSQIANAWKEQTAKTQRGTEKIGRGDTMQLVLRELCHAVAIAYRCSVPCTANGLPMEDPALVVCD